MSHCLKKRVSDLRAKVKAGVKMSVGMGWLLLTQACVSLPMGGGLMFHDPMNVDPAVFRMAMTGDAPLRLKQKGAQLTLSYSVSKPTAYVPESFEARYYFEEETAPLADETLKKARKVHVYRLEPAAAEALRLWQQKLKQHRAAGGDGKGSMAIGLSQGCREGTLPPGPIDVGIYGKTQPEAGFFLLAPRFDLRNFSWEEAGEKRTIADLPLCDA
jgi:hypothetical protein